MDEQSSWNINPPQSTSGDVNPQQPETIGQKILETGYKASGWKLRAKAIKSLVIGAIFIIGGIVAFILSHQFSALIISAVGLIALLGAWLYWKRSKSLVQGRYY